MSKRDFTKRSVERQLKGEGLRPKKGLGQNFLIDAAVLSDIVEAADIDGDTCVLEIGPGMGALTCELAKAAEKVVAVEIDTSILPVLQKNLAEFTNVTIVNQDILKVDLSALLTKHFGNRKVKVIANLPYYITTPIIMKLLEESQNISSIVVMIQREVAQRLAANAGSKDYGAITVAVQYRAEVVPIRDVPPEAFHPVPKVWSSVIRLSLRQHPPVQVKDEALFFRLVKAAFAQRRKTFLNSVGNFAGLSLDKALAKALLQKLHIPETVRGEALSIQQFAQITNEIIAEKLNG